MKTYDIVNRIGNKYVVTDGQKFYALDLVNEIGVVTDTALDAYKLIKQEKFDIDTDNTTSYKAVLDTYKFRFYGTIYEVTQLADVTQGNAEPENSVTVRPDFDQVVDKPVSDQEKSPLQKFLKSEVTDFIRDHYINGEIYTPWKGTPIAVQARYVLYLVLEKFFNVFPTVKDFHWYNPLKLVVTAVLKNGLLMLSFDPERIIYYKPFHDPTTEINVSINLKDFNRELISGGIDALKTDEALDVYTNLVRDFFDAVIPMDEGNSSTLETYEGIELVKTFKNEILDAVKSSVKDSIEVLDLEIREGEQFKSVGFVLTAKNNDKVIPAKISVEVESGASLSEVLDNIQAILKVSGFLTEAKSDEIELDEPEDEAESDEGVDHE